VKNILYGVVKMMIMPKNRVCLVCDCGFKVCERPGVLKIAIEGFNCPRCKGLIYVGK